jgi:SAM-dependent methyltransferase
MTTSTPIDPWQSLAQRKWSEAILGFTHLISEDADDLKAIEGLSRALAGDGAWREAAQALELILRRPIEREVASLLWARVGEYYFKVDAHQEWMTAFKNSLSMSAAPVELMIRFGRLLIESTQYAEAYRVLQRATLLDPQNVDAHIAMGRLYEARGQRQLAIQSYSTVAALSPQDSDTLQRLSALLNQRVPTWHFPMMNDHPRNQAFLKAIEGRIDEGDHVLDIGCGAGLLSLMSARAGAEAIYACESEPSVASVAIEVMERNGYEDTVRIIPKRSTDMKVGAGADLPDRLDMLVCEIFDVSLLGEDALHTIQHAKAHLLREGAKIIPSAARVWCQIVESDDLRARYFVNHACDFDLRPFNRLRDPRVLQLDLKRFQYRPLIEPTLALEIDFEDDFTMSDNHLISAEVIEAGRADGFIFWYELILDEDQGITLSTAPHDEGTHWLQGFAPNYEDQPTLTQGEFTQFICAYRRFLLWFQHLS